MDGNRGTAKVELFRSRLSQVNSKGQYVLGSCTDLLLLQALVISVIRVVLMMYG